MKIKCRLISNPWPQFICISSSPDSICIALLLHTQPIAFPHIFPSQQLYAIPIPNRLLSHPPHRGRQPFIGLLVDWAMQLQPFGRWRNWDRNVIEKKRLRILFGYEMTRSTTTSNHHLFHCCSKRRRRRHVGSKISKI